MSLYAMPPMSYAKKQEEVPSQTEVGTKEDLGENVSAELAKDYKQVEEKLDVAPTEKPATKQEDNRSVEELKNDIQSFREQIKIGETKDGNGRYNEQLVLENEARLREAEKLLASKQEKANQENELAALREEIKGYRENIKIGETKDGNGRYNEQLVLENEAKLREAEKKIASLNNQTAINTPEEPTIETNNPIAVAPEKPKKKKGFFSRFFGFGKKE